MNKLEWKCLSHIDIDSQKSEKFVSNNLFCRDCYSVFADDKGILVIFSLNDVICIKLKLSSDKEKVMTLNDISTIKGINGSSLVYDNTNSFLLDTDGNLYKFRSFKKISALPQRNLKCLHFTGESYVIVEQVEMILKVKLYDSFGETFSENCEFDLSFCEDPITLGGNRDNEKVCALLIDDITKDRDVRFFSELLACQLELENVMNVLLVSIDERLSWIKFSGNFKTELIDDYSIELLTTKKSRIVGLHYYKTVLMLIDELSVLSVFYMCQQTKLIRKKEIVVGGKIRCFRFYGSNFICSTREKFTIIDLKEPSKPSEKYAIIKNINCFTVVDNLKFVIAICKNNLVYHIRLIQKCQTTSDENGTCFLDILDSDIEAIPAVSKFFATEEKKFLQLQKQIQDSQNLKQLLERLQMEPGDFIAGEATIKFHQNIPNSYDDSVRLCHARDLKLKACILEVDIKFHPIFASSNLTLVLAYKNVKSTTSTRRIKIENVRTREKVCFPVDGQVDKMKCDINVEVSLNSEISHRLCPLNYRINVASIIRPNDPDLQLEDDLKRCKEIVERLKT